MSLEERILRKENKEYALLGLKLTRRPTTTYPITSMPRLLFNIRTVSGRVFNKHLTYSRWSNVYLFHPGEIVPLISN